MIKTVVSIASGKMLYSTLAQVDLQEGEVLVTERPNTPLVKPYFNFETREFYEGATQAEIDELAIKQEENSNQRILELESELSELKANLIKE